jgi:hypothetical protein
MRVRLSPLTPMEHLSVTFTLDQTSPGIKWTMACVPGLNSRGDFDGVKALNFDKEITCLTCKERLKWALDELSK